MKERKKFEVIKKISEIILEFLPKKNIIVTVVDLKLPKRKGNLKVFLSVYPEKEREEIIKYFNNLSKEIKNEIKERVYLRHLPSKIVFYPSDEFVYAQKVLELINEIENEIKEKETKRSEN